MRLHHVQVSIPAGGEAEARRFWTALGLVEVPKPAPLAARGGCWFRADDSEKDGGAEIHVGVETPFVPARRAHPALHLGGVEELRAAVERLGAAGFEVDWSERDTFAPHVRCHVRDAHGNRVELLASA